MTKWHSAERPKRQGGGVYPGVRYREHASRKMDAVNLDRYFAVTYWWQSKTVTEGVGWASEGHGAEEAADLLAKIKQNQKSGEGPCTLTEIRNEASDQRKSLEQEKREQARLDISFQEYFDTYYLPEVRQANKPETVQKTESHVRIWIVPVVKDTPMRDISLAECKTIKRNLVDAGRSPRMIQYVFISFESVWRTAQDDGCVTGRAPSKVRSFKKTLPKLDNRKERFLTMAEEKLLLAGLKEKSELTHDITIVAIDTGLRWSEITALTWDRVDFEQGVFHLTRTKRGESRWVPFTQRVRSVLMDMGAGFNGEFVFKNRYHEQVTRLSQTFMRVVKKTGLNDGITDNKMKVTFHSLRHTFASRVLKAGASIYETSKLLGHGSVKVTERYAHVVQEDLGSAVRRMEAMQADSQGKGKVIPLKCAK